MQEVIRTLIDSPWVHDVKLRASEAGLATGDMGAGGVGPSGIPRNQQENQDIANRARLGVPPIQTPIPESRRVDLAFGITVRWLSSETLRKTLARYWTLRGQPKQAATVGGLAHHYAIGLKGPGAGSLSQIYLSSQQDALRHTPYLEFLPSKQRVFVRGVEVVKEGALAPTTDFVLYFPRTAEGGPELGSEAEKAKLFCEYEIGKRVFRVKVEFDLKKMIRDGKPDL